MTLKSACFLGMMSILEVVDMFTVTNLRFLPKQSTILRISKFNTYYSGFGQVVI